jgi:hypothetical protein
LAENICIQVVNYITVPMQHQGSMGKGSSAHCGCNNFDFTPTAKVSPCSVFDDTTHSDHATFCSQA